MSTELSANHGTVDNMKDRLVRDLKNVIDDGDNLLHGVANSTAQEIAAARTRIEGTLGEARSRLDDARVAVSEKARSAAGATQAYVTENPWKLLGIAAAAALVIGALLGSRR